jgi:predicted DNA-binding transcriptional regulator AlpA
MKTVTHDEALALAGGVSKVTLLRWEREGRWPARRRLGPKLPIWDRDEIEACLRRLPRETAAAS